MSFFLYLLIGGFNVDFMSPSRALFSKLQCIASSFVLSQAVTESTHYSHTGVPSVIDLAFVSRILSISCSILYHHPILVHLTIWEFSSPIKYYLLTNGHAPLPKGKYGVTLLVTLKKANEVLDQIDWKYIIDETSVGRTGRVLSSML